MNKLPERIQKKILINKRNGCWEWTGYKSQNKPPRFLPYGQIKVDGKVKKIHRVVYELTIGEIAQGFVIDHLCRNTICINPKHLEQVTVTVNNRRAIKNIRTIDKVPTIRNTSGYTGVGWSDRDNKWRAYITKDKKRKDLGYYKTIEEAISARMSAEAII